jgi:hypothetical protein
MPAVRYGNGCPAAAILIQAWQHQSAAAQQAPWAGRQLAKLGPCHSASLTWAHHRTMAWPEAQITQSLLTFGCVSRCGCTTQGWHMLLPMAHYSWPNLRNVTPCMLPQSTRRGSHFLKFGQYQEQCSCRHGLQASLLPSTQPAPEPLQLPELTCSIWAGRRGRAGAPWPPGASARDSRTRGPEPSWTTHLARRGCR